MFKEKSQDIKKTFEKIVPLSSLLTLNKYFPVVLGPLFIDFEHILAHRNTTYNHTSKELKYHKPFCLKISPIFYSMVPLLLSKEIFLIELYKCA